MGLDIRLPIGLMFTVMGVLLAGYGLIGDKEIYRVSLGTNINLIWGAIMTIFGIIFLVLGKRGTSAMRSVPASAEGRAIEEIEHRTGKESERRPGH